MRVWGRWLDERPRASGEAYGQPERPAPSRQVERTGSHRHVRSGDQARPQSNSTSAWYRLAARELGVPYSELAAARLFPGIAAERHRAAADSASVVALDGPDAMMLAVAPGRAGMARLKR